MACVERPAANGRDTVVVAGGGFTGIEAATEMPTRLREILGPDAKTRVVIVDRNTAIAPDMGAGARPVIEEALRKVGVETRLGAGVAALDDTGVTLSSGEHIETETVIWAAGIRAAPLTAQIPPSATISDGCWSIAACRCQACRVSSRPATRHAPPATTRAITH